MKPKGRPRKYDFKGMKLGQIRQFKDTSCDYLGKCAKNYSEFNELGWVFRCFAEKKTKITNLLRIK